MSNDLTRVSVIGLCYHCGLIKGIYAVEVPKGTPVRAEGCFNKKPCSYCESKGAD
jgi:hypothetical protein